MPAFFSKLRKRVFLEANWPYPRTLYTRASRSEDDSSASDDESHDGLLEKELNFRTVSPSCWRRHRNVIIVHLVISVLYSVVLFVVATRRPRCLRDVDLPFSPAIEALEYQESKFSLEDRIQDRGSFSGRPSPELDRAWHDLLNYENIKLEPEVMEHYGRADIGVAIPEGGAYLGTLNVYHELHCLKRLHQYMYPDYYFPDVEDDQREMNRLHNEHCIDFLRQSAMCHGDIGLITFEWNENSRIPVANATTHQCVNWEKLYAWTRERSVDMMKPGWLTHPTLGLAYPNGEGDPIGALRTGTVAHNHE